MTVAILVQQLLVMTRVVKQFFEPWAARLADNGDLDRMMKINIVAFIIQLLLRAVPIFLVVYFQAGIVDRLLNLVPANILAGLGTASAILPALGLSILLTLMIKGILWPFLLLECFFE